MLTVSLLLKTVSCAPNAVLPLVVHSRFAEPSAVPPLPGGLSAHVASLPSSTQRLLFLPVGSCLYEPNGTAVFRVVGRIFLPPPPNRIHSWICPLLQALQPVNEAAPRLFSVRKPGWTLAWITLSDKGASGERDDCSGPLLAELVGEHLSLSHEQGFLLPDEPSQLRALVAELALGQGYDLVLTSGGTGLGPRDTTPEALLPLLERRLTGLEHAMFQNGLLHTPLAALSRPLAGTIGRTLTITLPGSQKAVEENLAAVLPLLGHALDKLHGDTTPCGN